LKSPDAEIGNAWLVKVYAGLAGVPPAGLAPLVKPSHGKSRKSSGLRPVVRMWVFNLVA